MMEDACRPHDLDRLKARSRFNDEYSQAHVVTGLENFNNPTALQASWLQDARLRHLALTQRTTNTITATSQNANTAKILADAFESGGQAAVREAVESIILKLLSKLVLMPVEKLKSDLARPLADFGMDSMVSSEIRSRAWKEFSADIPLLKLLEKSMLIGELMDLVWEKMDPSLKGETT